ncbi:MAG: GNAT family N-acetyltransferase [Rhodobacteraceae bacterium]|nr:GNAT family N-acetyltransferase [Paracoccaceae bacterium]
MTLIADVQEPSKISTNNIALWHQYLRDARYQAAAFLSPEFSRACERAYGSARVAVLHEDGDVIGFFPFQFSGPFASKLGYAVRIGEELSDCAGVVARDGTSIPERKLLRICSLTGYHVSHLPLQQKEIRLDRAPTDSEIAKGHLINLSDGPEAYLENLTAANVDFVRDTERRMRRLAKDLGPIKYRSYPRPTSDQVRSIVERKRLQYRATKAEDVFAASSRLTLLLELTRVDSDFCRLHVSELCADEDVIASHIGLLGQGTLNYWFPVYEPDLRKYSPGRLLLWHTIQHAKDDGITLINRGEGDTQAKRDFSNAEQYFARRLMVRDGVAGVIARGFSALDWRLSTLRRVLARE